jgi:hypothetical protein
MPQLKELRHDQCRYPLTAEAPFIMCGRQTAGRKSYCAKHYALCVTKKVRPLEFLAEWINDTDPMSRVARPQPEERVRPLDEVLT